jgi:hypothetical protein
VIFTLASGSSRSRVLREYASADMARGPCGPTPPARPRNPPPGRHCCSTSSAAHSSTRHHRGGKSGEGTTAGNGRSRTVEASCGSCSSVGLWRGSRGAPPPRLRALPPPRLDDLFQATSSRGSRSSAISSNRESVAVSPSSPCRRRRRQRELRGPQKGLRDTSPPLLRDAPRQGTEPAREEAAPPLPASDPPPAREEKPAREKQGRCAPPEMGRRGAAGAPPAADTTPSKLHHCCCSARRRRCYPPPRHHWLDPARGSRRGQKEAGAPLPYSRTPARGERGGRMGDEEVGGRRAERTRSGERGRK